MKINIRNSYTTMLSSIATLTISISSLMVSCSSLEVSKESVEINKQSNEYNQKKDEDSLKETVLLRTIVDRNNPEYIKIEQNEKGEYVIFTEFNLEVVNTSQNTISLTGIEVDNSKVDKIHIEDEDTNLISDENGNFKESIKLEKNDNIAIKLRVYEVLKYNNMDEFKVILDKAYDLMKEKVSKEDEYYKNLVENENEVLEIIYEESRYNLIMKTSRSEIYNFIKLYN